MTAKLLWEKNAKPNWTSGSADQKSDNDSKYSSLYQVLLQCSSAASESEAIAVNQIWNQTKQRSAEK